MSSPAVVASATRNGAPPTTHRGEASGRMLLLQSLLAAETVTEAARRVVEYLHTHVGARRVVYLGTHDADARLQGLASRGVDEAHALALEVDLDVGTHPLLRTLSPRSPTPVEIPDLARLFPGGRLMVTPVPLPLTRVGEPLALLLTEPRAALEEELGWVACVLGPELARARRHEDLSRAYAGAQRDVALMRGVLDAVPEPVLLADGDSNVLLANSDAALYFASPEEGSSEGRRRALALNRMLLSAVLASTRSAGTQIREVAVVDPSDGSDRLFELIAAHTSTVAGEGTVAVLRNVSDLHSAMREITENYRRLRVAEADVRAERDRLDLIIDSVADPIIVTGMRGVPLRMNRPAEGLLTADPDASPARAQRVRTNDARLSSHVSNVFFTPEPRVRGDLDLLDPAGMRDLPMEAVSRKLMSAHGEVAAVVTILHDRTEAEEKQRLNEQLEQATAQLEKKVQEATIELVKQNELLRRQHIQLEQASSLKSQFLATMSHEFRTPLNAILGYTSMLLDNIYGAPPPRQIRCLERVDSNARHLLAIINDILDISRIEAGSMPIHRSTFDVGKLLTEVLSEVRPLVARDRVKVELAVSSRLPRLRTDRAKVKQILVNLLSNAFKFTAAGTVAISARLSPRGRWLHVAVADTGVGVAPEDAEVIFQDFRQADNSTTRRFGGTGLGLAISRRLAEVLGGRIKLVSELGQGSTFTLILPRRRRSS